MRVLYLTNDRTRQVLDSFSCLREALAEITEVKTICRPLTGVEVDHCRDACDGKPTIPLVDPDEANAYDWVICDAPWSFLSENWSAITAKKAVIWADNHGVMVAHYIGRFFHDFGCDLFLPLYIDGARQFHPYIPSDRMHHLPVWVNTEQFRDWGEPKKYDVLLTGAVHPVVYPVRHEVWEQCDGQPWFTRIQRPGYEFDAIAKGRWPLAHDFGKVLNSARIAVACVSRFKYPIGKIFEIPACRTVLASDYCPEMVALGYVPFQNFLPLKVGQNHREVLQGYLTRPDLQQIADNGHRLIQERHTATVRARQLLSALSARR